VIEKEMEDLIASYPNEFFPRHKFALQGRQGYFHESGRYDLLFVDEFGTQVLMELKAVPAKYENATQLARYKDALREKNITNVLMWLVAPSIPRSVRDFLDQIGIEYTEIHEAEFRKVAVRHGYLFAREELIAPTDSLTSSTKTNQKASRTRSNMEDRGTASWFFNTDEVEPEGKGAYAKMLDKSCAALWVAKGKKLDPEKALSKPASGERVFFYLKEVGFIATGLFTNDPPIPDDSIFRKGTPRAFSRRVSDLVTVANSSAVTPSEVKSMGGKLLYFGPLCKISDQQIADKILAELKSRSQR
jgi:hypothetical protein